ncbi:MAG: SAM-dependent methyltransferase, partial [Gemmatimonadales bacterium]
MTRLRRSVAVALFSAAALTYEVLLVRAFAIEQFHHFAYMAISVAMLGFGASGTVLALAGRLHAATAERLFAWSGVVAAISLVASPALVDLISLDATQLAWD